MNLVLTRNAIIIITVDNIQKAGVQTQRTYNE